MTRIARAVPVLACIAAGVTALFGEPGAAAALAVVAALSIVLLVRDRRPMPLSASMRPAAELAEEVVRATSFAAVEAVVTREIARFESLETQWTVVTKIVPDSRDDLHPMVQRELARVLTKAGDIVSAATRVPLVVGEALVLPCGAGSDLLLVVAASSRIEAEVELELADLAVLVGFGAKHLAISRELDEKRIEARFEELVRFSSDAILITDAVGVIRYAAPSVTTVLGYRSAAVEGRSILDFLGSDRIMDVSRFLADVARREPRQTTSAELRVERADGRFIDTDVTGANLLENPDVRGIVITLRDVTTRRSLEAQLRHQAFHDALTGLANRALFRDRLENAMRVRRTSFDPQPAVAYIDLDDFKNVNDSLGHDVGDHLLRTVAERISSCLRGADTAARLGGDEFALLLDAATDVDAMVATVQRVVDAVCVPLKLEDGRIIGVRASAGVAIAGHDDITSEDLLRHADMAMYRAKTLGKAQVVVYESGMNHAAIDRLALTAELDSAIREGMIGAEFQPIADLETGQIVGVEVVPRWDHPTRGTLGPAELLPLAEETGLVVALGLGVLRRGLDGLAAWHRNGFGDLYLAVDVSPCQLRVEGFQSTLLAALADHDIHPSRLVLEVTERVLGTSSEAIETALTEIVGAGVRLAVDGFGDGHVSLRHLRDIHFDQVKINTDLLTQIESERGRTVTETVIQLAASLQADSVAVGVDSAEDLSVLREMGCRFGQGRYLAAGGDQDAVGHLLAEPLAPLAAGTSSGARGLSAS